MEALDENSGVPKDKFRAILERRQAQMAQMPGMMPGAELSAAGTGLPAGDGLATAGMQAPGPGLPQMGMGG